MTFKNWIAHKGSGGFFLEIDGNHVLGGEEHRLLIEAAPDLYRACEKAIATIERLIDHKTFLGEPVSHLFPILEDITLATLKARGHSSK